MPQKTRIPQYNGVTWFFPASVNRRQPRPLETFILWLFTVVNTVQTLSLFIWPTILITRFGFLYTLLSLPVTLPLASDLDDKYGPNYGTAYTSLNTTYLTFFAMRYIVVANIEAFEPRAVIYVMSYMVLLFLIGNALCVLEKYVFGRAWNAALVVYAHILVWAIQGTQYMGNG